MKLLNYKEFKKMVVASISNLLNIFIKKKNYKKKNFRNEFTYSTENLKGLK